MAILVAFNPPIQTDEMATVWLENVVSELKCTIDPTTCPRTDRLITDPAVLAKLDTIVTFKDRPFDTLKLLSCIAPALRKGLQKKYHISSAIKVGLLPEGFKLVENYDWEQNIVEWRGPWVENVLKQDCVVGAIRERDVIDARSKRDQSIQQALQGFGMATVQVPDDIRVQDLVDSSTFDVFVQASFLDRSFEERQQLKTVLGAWEQTKKEVSATAKRKRSRDAIAEVNSFNQEGLQQASEQAEAQKVQRDFDLLQSSIEKCQKKSDECFNQYRIAASRGEKIDKLLNGANPPPFSQANKRCIEMLLSNVSNGEELWNVAVQEESKIRGMEIQGNERAESMRSEFSTTWAGIEERKYNIDVDCGIMHATNLACSWEDHHAEMEALFASKLK